jgi:ferritin-like metal-binding protein YciE
MKMVSVPTEIPAFQADVDKLRVALDIERKIADAVPQIADRSIDRHLATEFKRRLKQTECQIARLENLFRNATGVAA